MIMLIVGALLMSAAIVLAFMRPTAGVVCAYAGVWALRTAGNCPVATATILFWAIAVLLVVSIDMARHTPLLIPFRARCFITGGALAAMAIGIAIWPNGTIICTAAGVILGLIAYAGTAHFRDYRTLSRWGVAAGLPAIITASLIAISLLGLIAKAPAA